jgi:hypothetical protein
MPSEPKLYTALGVVFTILLGALLVWAIARLLMRSRRDFALALPLIVGFGLRVASAGAIGLTSLGPSLRGGDEPFFIQDAHLIAKTSFLSTPWLHALTGTGHIMVNGLPVSLADSLHVFLMSAQVKLFSADPYAMRVTMAAIATIGLGLIATAAYELGGRRAGLWTAWILVLDPANMFFSTTLHKEPALYLAEGMVVLGGALMWKRPRLSAVALMVFGCLVATSARHYVGWFLAAGSAIVLLHAAVRSASSGVVRAAAVLTVLIGAAVVSTPSIINATSNEELRTLQVSQTANATETNANLKLEPVDFSTRTAIIKNLPRRMFDVLTRPYPWQIANTSQRLGVIESLVVFACLVLLVQAVVRGGALALAGPLMYPALMLLIAYSLAAGNAGTSFRYRTHIVALFVAAIAVLRERGRATSAEETATAQSHGPWRPVGARA